MASSILAIVAVTAVLPFTVGTQNAVEAQRLEQAVELGEALMEEILARSFLAPGESAPTPGPESGETTRQSYNSIDDYSGYSESDRIIRNFKGAPVNDPSMADFWRTVTVTYVTFPSQQTGDTNSLARIEVSVFYGTRLMAKLSRLVSRED